MLLVGDRVVLRAPSPPDTEYGLFEIGDIELRASEPGRVREHGYQTTAERARNRLESMGISANLARECASFMQPVLAEAYARGPAVRHVSRYLGAVELFQSDTFEPVSQTYRGVFLDLPELVQDLDLSPSERSSATFQALYLAALLDAEAPDTTVFLKTDAWTRNRKPGERTHKRPHLGDARKLASALSDLARLEPRPEIKDQLARADVLAFLRARSDAAPDEDARALYRSLEQGISLRNKPDRGPLADPELWGIEQRIDQSQLEGIMLAVEDVERTRGRTPGTTYIRARASLALRLEPPKLIAERVSALALSMTSFSELLLLAAEAWLDAGDSRRALPYARDLVDAPGIDEGLLLKAQRILARAVGAAPETSGGKRTYADSMHASPLPATRSAPPQRPSKSPLSAPELHAPQTFIPAQSRVPTQKGGTGAAEVLPPAPPSSQRPVSVPEDGPVMMPTKPPSVREPSGPSPSLEPPNKGASLRARQRPGAADVVLPSARPPPLDLELTPPPMISGIAASYTLDVPGPTPGPESRGPATPRSPTLSSRPPPSARPIPRTDAPTEPRIERGSKKPPLPSKKPPAPPSHRGGVTETRPPPKFDPRAEPESERNLFDDEAPAVGFELVPETEPEKLAATTGPKPARRSSAPPAPHAPLEKGVKSTVRYRESAPPPSARNLLPSKPPPTPKAAGPSVAPPSEEEKALMRGASLPPYRMESPTPSLSKAPLLPRLGGTGEELVEHLPLPPGIGAESMPVDILPKSVLEARVQFTMLARELGLDYRLKRGIDLKADVSGIEAMQSVLLETFPTRVVRNDDEAYELRRHGALLSEILARRLDAEWLDISPNDLGYWAMIVPPDTRVWPFGRVARLVAMGHKERDLVAYFLELKSRARSA